ncbi:DUF1376 domain-containing protein [Burkholderia gladioli]|nr:DUF1376 domain-containing protein [Burkholderia gladioli]
MNYYERYCGDYQRDTAHLSLTEHGAFADLPAFFGPLQSWKTASVASVEQYRCLNSLGVR